MSLGDTSLGGALVPGARARFLISSVEYTGKIAPSSIHIELNLNAIGSMKLTLHDVGGTTHLKTGEPVDLMWNGVKIFSGPIKKVQEIVHLGGSCLNINIEASDWSSLADKFYVNEIFENMSVTDIVVALVNLHPDPTVCLAADGVSTTHVQAGGPIVTKVTFSQKKLSRCLDDLADLFGWVWFIDPERNLYFFDRGLYRAPYNFGEGYNGNWNSAQFNEDLSNYFNRLILRAGKERTDAQSQDFFGNGKDEEFTLRFPVAEKPVIEISLNGGAFNAVDPANVGIRGKDEEEDANQVPTNFLWFYQIDDEKITQNSHSAKLTSVDILRVKYIGLFPIIVQADNENEQKARATIEGGPGVYMGVDEDETIDGIENAIERASGLLKKNDSIDKKFLLTTYQVGFMPGQLSALKFSMHNVDGDFLIEKVIILDVAMKFLQYNLEMSDSGDIATDALFWKRLADQGRTFTIRENEKLNFLKKVHDEFAQDESALLETGNQLAAWTDDADSVFRIGYSRLTSARFAEVKYP